MSKAVSGLLFISNRSNYKQAHYYIVQVTNLGVLAVVKMNVFHMLASVLQYTSSRWMRVIRRRIWTVSLNSRGKLLLKLPYSNSPSLPELQLAARQSGRLVDTFRYCILAIYANVTVFVFISDSGFLNQKAVLCGMTIYSILHRVV